MHITGKRLPLIRYEHAKNLDVWRLDNGIGITLSDDQGTIYAGGQFTKEAFDEAVAFINKQFNEPQG